MAVPTLVPTPGALLPWIERRFFSITGTPLASGSLASFVAGTTTPLETYADNQLTVANPVVMPLDATGAWTSPIYLKPQSYKFVVKDVNGVVQAHYPADNVQDVGQLFATYYGYAVGTGRRAVNTNVTLGPADHYVTVKPASSGALPIYLPAAAYATWPVTIKNIGVAGGAVQITPNGADQIEGQGLLTLPAGNVGSWPAVTLLSNGSNAWEVISSHKFP